MEDKQLIDKMKRMSKEFDDINIPEEFITDLTNVKVFNSLSGKLKFITDDNALMRKHERQWYRLKGSDILNTPYEKQVDVQDVEKDEENILKGDFRHSIEELDVVKERLTEQDKFNRELTKWTENIKKYVDEQIELLAERISRHELVLNSSLKLLNKKIKEENDNLKEKGTN